MKSVSLPRLAGCGGPNPQRQSRLLRQIVENLTVAIPAVQPRPDNGRRFALTHFWIPLILLLAATWVLMLMPGDLWLADRIYALEGSRWSLREAWVTTALLHDGGHDLSVVAWLVVLLSWVASCINTRLAPWRRPLGYLLLAVAMATASVAWVKAWSNMDCPWDLLRYGGSRPYVDLFSLRPLGLDRGRCFPAGHASAGFAWMALYFFFLMARPRWRHLGLALGLLLGLAFGIDQQLRGAHFASHDVWSAGICWLVALGLYLPFRHGHQPRRGPAAPQSAAAKVATGRLP